MLQITFDSVRKKSPTRKLDKTDVASARFRYAVIESFSPLALEDEISFESAVVVPPDVKTKAKAYKDIIN